jgi:hypothetical protein
MLSEASNPNPSAVIAVCWREAKFLPSVKLKKYGE